MSVYRFSSRSGTPTLKRVFLTYRVLVRDIDYTNYHEEVDERNTNIHEYYTTAKEITTYLLDSCSPQGPKESKALSSYSYLRIKDDDKF